MSIVAPQTGTQRPRSATRLAGRARRLADRVTRPRDEPKISARHVQAAELTRHIVPGRSRAGDAGDSLVGLAFSGGGIRSATFGLGILQALRSLGVYKEIDYISSVSGGGYINGWLQALTARGALPDGLPVDDAPTGERYEPRQVRFLRAYSNYLTPKLGLFSGDTWAAVGISLRNLVLNLGVLSLSLIAPLYLPWFFALEFWRVASIPAGVSWPLWLAWVLVAITVGMSTMNMSAPLKDGSWDKPVGHQASTVTVLAFVVMPALLAVCLLSPLAWAWARQQAFDSGQLLWFSIRGGAWYASVWLAGATAGYALGRARNTGTATTAGTDWSRARHALLVLVTAAFGAGMIGAVVAGVGVRWLATTMTGEFAWMAWMLVYPLCVVALLLSVTVHIGLSGRWLSEETREWWGRVGGVQLLITLMVVLSSALSLAGPHIWSWSLLPAVSAHRDTINTLLGAAWAAVTGAGVLAGHSSRTDGASSSLLDRLGRIAPIVFVLGYLVILATFLHAQIDHPLVQEAQQTLAVRYFTLEEIDAVLTCLANPALPTCQQTGPGLVSLPWYEPTLLLVAVLLSGGAIWLSRRVDQNEFSLHALYRNRLVRCYLGASHRDRAAHPFTGFDPRDDMPLAAETLTPDRPIRPYPLFNVTMNLVGGKNLAWQQRKAASFLLSPEYCGFEYRTDEDNEEDKADPETAHQPATRRAYAKTAEHGRDPRSLTLGLAMATSGAAASPNMGYHTSPTLAFLMTIFNVRLGWWLRNPRWGRTWSDENARLSLRELMSELLGMTTDERDWVYLSDGGHFENLGIYELVRRRCRFIIASDAGQDGAITFEDLGNAIEKCRADFGINIEINLDRLRPSPGSKMSAAHCAIGTIRYDQQNPNDQAGTLLYIKATLTGDEPADVLRYASAHAAFPHESTSDQFFDESQFESYRALGYHVGCSVLTAAAEKQELAQMPAVEFFTHLRQHWSVPAPIPPDAVRKYSGVLSEIWSTVRSSDALTFMDRQMFPAWASLLIHDVTPPPATTTTTTTTTNTATTEDQAAVEPTDDGLWLPADPESRRAGFYACSQMLQLMEDVYIEFRLDEHYDHIDNRGWMNLFQHWAWSGMLSATWGMTGSMYDPRFQRFCRRRLGLDLGTTYVLDYRTALPRPGEWRAFDEETRRHQREQWQLAPIGLNFFEVQLVDRFLTHTGEDRSLFLLPIRVYVPSPKRDANNLDFGVGYLIADIDDDRKVCWLHHIRIQNHLRKMGLARQALRLLKSTEEPGWGLALKVVAPTDARGSGNVAFDEALPSRRAARDLKRLLDSLA